MGQREDLFLGVEAATPALRRYARALGVGAGAAAADDMVQTAIDGVASRIRARELRETEAARDAAYQIVTSLARESRAGFSELRSASPRQSALTHALGELPFDERAALLLVVVEGLSYEVVARILNAPSEAVVMWLKRARAALSPIDLHPPAPCDGARRAAHLRVVK